MQGIQVGIGLAVDSGARPRSDADMVMAWRWQTSARKSRIVDQSS
jgi:hypothetical protein